MRLAAVILIVLETYYGVVLFEKKLLIWKAINPYKVSGRLLLVLVWNVLLLGRGLQRWVGTIFGLSLLCRTVSGCRILHLENLIFI